MRYRLCYFVNDIRTLYICRVKVTPNRVNTILLPYLTISLSLFPTMNIKPPNRAINFLVLFNVNKFLILQARGALLFMG